jgi:hypothetical protein
MRLLRTVTDPSHSGTSGLLTLVSFFRCPSPPRHLVYVSRVDPSVLSFGLPLHRHPCLDLLIKIWNVPPYDRTLHDYHHQTSQKTWLSKGLIIKTRYLVKTETHNENRSKMVFPPVIPTKIHCHKSCCDLHFWDTKKFLDPEGENNRWGLPCSYLKQNTLRLSLYIIRWLKWTTKWGCQHLDHCFCFFTLGQNFRLFTVSRSTQQVSRTVP